MQNVQENVQIKITKSNKNTLTTHIFQSGITAYWDNFSLALPTDMKHQHSRKININIYTLEETNEEKNPTALLNPLKDAKGSQ